MNETKAARATFNRLLELKGRPPVHGASDLLDKHGFFGGVADELSPATEDGRTRIRALVARALERGWCKRHYANSYKNSEPRGKFSLPEAFCLVCGKRPSYCRCASGPKK